MLDKLNSSVVTGDVTLLEEALFPFAYMKLVEGPLPRRHFAKYRFYDEKEIRLVPDKESIVGFAPFLIDDQYDK